MYSYISGKIVQKYVDSLIIDCQGIGYQILYDELMADRFAPVGQQVKIWTYLHVREDAMILYGFPGQKEKDMFSLLLTVSGVGPKLAGAIVAALEVEDFALAVLNDDLTVLTQVKGVGKKSAQRLILELKDKLKKNLPQLATGEGVPVSAEDTDLTVNRPNYQEAVSALIVLGYREQEALSAVKQAAGLLPDNYSLQDLIKKSLQSLSII